MPKFLDVPQWYVSDGTLMSLPKDKPSQYLSTLKTNSDGTTKWEKAAVNSCNGSVDGGAMIYAPISAGSYGQIAVSTGAVPSWATLGINGKTGFALGDNIKIYAPTSNPPGGYVLTSSGSGAPSWQDFDVNGGAIGTNSSQIYAPQNAGTSGQILMSTGGIPGWRDLDTCAIHYASITDDGTRLGTLLPSSGILIIYHGTTNVVLSSFNGMAIFVYRLSSTFFVLGLTSSMEWSRINGINANTTVSSNSAYTNVPSIAIYAN